MDITRNWRLKSTRSQLLATRDPQTGAVVLPQQTAPSRANVETYTFDEADTANNHESESAYAQAAR